MEEGIKDNVGPTQSITCEKRKAIITTWWERAGGLSLGRILLADENVSWLLPLLWMMLTLRLAKRTPNGGRLYRFGLKLGFTLCKLATDSELSELHNSFRVGFSTEQSGRWSVRHYNCWISRWSPCNNITKLSRIGWQYSTRNPNVRHKIPNINPTPLHVVMASEWKSFI